MDKKIKVAQVITRMDWGGSPDIVRNICSYLDPAVYDVTLVAGLSLNQSRRTKEFLAGMSGKVVSIPSLRREINPFMDLAAFLGLYRLFKKEKFDIVHTHTSKAGALGRMAAYFAGVRVIVHTPHGHLFYGYYGRLRSYIIMGIERLLTAISSRVIALTELEKGDMVFFKVASPKKVAVIYQGIEFNECAPQVKRDEPLVGMIGRLEPVKGPLYFVEAAREVARSFPSARFMITGEGSMRRSIEKRISELGLKDRISLTGWREDMPAVFASLDVLVLPSLNEAVGIVLLEAQGCGIPVVATSVGGIPEVVKDGETGILVPPADPHRIAQAICDLLADPHKRKVMSDLGKHWVRDRFGAKEMARKISDLYKGLLG